MEGSALIMLICGNTDNAGTTPPAHGRFARGLELDGLEPASTMTRSGANLVYVPPCAVADLVKFEAGMAGRCSFTLG